MPDFFRMTVTRTAAFVAILVAAAASSVADATVQVTPRSSLSTRSAVPGDEVVVRVGHVRVAGRQTMRLY
jgi:hypothetical protein